MGRDLWRAELQRQQCRSVICYGTAFNWLNAMRQTKSYVAVPAMPAKSIRWFDRFTNTIGSTITANIAFRRPLDAVRRDRMVASSP
ncbi:hypothetical protein [Pseudaminobacter soli (ex Li et al. 2025)]|uniref:Uncharacterized protein n=1 Tax=Pseudaminobacter soli (ex Li et al. 2025) TaxID=1295366 RepID=A0A2P7RU83_9HYPH|nr:hypothetical protein [Mesorhizobium soli]PSJ53787.1 hypothetical protein C7I85_27865 [Mesorhizobium soli]